MACFHFWPSTKQTGKTPTKTGEKRASLARARTGQLSPLRARVYWSRSGWLACRSMAWGRVFLGRENGGMQAPTGRGILPYKYKRTKHEHIYIFKSQGRLILKPSIKSAGLGKYPQIIKTCGIQQRA